MFAVVASFVSYFEYHGLGSQEGIIRRGSKEKRAISLTFDDGPNPNFTPKILDVLKEKNVKGSFFVTGAHVHKYPDIARRIVSEGHDIGNHTYSHREIAPSTRKAILWQLKRADNIIHSATGVRTRLFRPPRGIYSNASRKLLVSEGYQIVLWTISSIDWRGINAKVMAKRVLKYARNGGIVLFHDSGALIRKEGASRENTVEALSLIIDGLKERGFDIVPVSEFLLNGKEKEAER
ncbi:MAG: polysaccharide deacetylase family protein [Actinobacteria bacterium]|nr:polysaccharide deacetylase family protein [Actinomycetota bacterium]